MLMALRPWPFEGLPPKGLPIDFPSYVAEGIIAAAGISLRINNHSC